MTNDPAHPSPRRILASVAVIGFVVGGAAAAWSAVEDEERSTLAGLFPAGVVDLRLDGPIGVDGFLRGENLAPGDRVHGVLRLSAAKPTDGSISDLDLGVAVTFRGPAGIHRLDDALVVTRLGYGADDLVDARDGGLDIRDALDTDRDGRISVRELARGVNDLPPPRAEVDGGTGLAIEVMFRPREGAQGADFGGQQLDIRFTFQLGDRLGPDL